MMTEKDKDKTQRDNLVSRLSELGRLRARAQELEELGQALERRIASLQQAAWDLARKIITEEPNFSVMVDPRGWPVPMMEEGNDGSTAGDRSSGK